MVYIIPPIFLVIFLGDGKHDDGFTLTLVAAGGAQKTILVGAHNKAN
jgi:hypothetical protein